MANYWGPAAMGLINGLRSTADMYARGYGNQQQQAPAQNAITNDQYWQSRPQPMQQQPLAAPGPIETPLQGYGSGMPEVPQAAETGTAPLAEAGGNMQGMGELLKNPQMLQSLLQMMRSGGQ